MANQNRDADTSCSFDYLAEMFAEKRGTRNPADVPKVRPCIRCRRPFRSRGIAHRVCWRCKREESFRT